MLKLIFICFKMLKVFFFQQNGIILVDHEALIFCLERMFAEKVCSTFFKQEAL
jgi:uncharacterized membrane protein (Fun14 family)